MAGEGWVGSGTVLTHAGRKLLPRSHRTADLMAHFVRFQNNTRWQRQRCRSESYCNGIMCVCIMCVRILVVDRNDTSEHKQTHNAVAQKTILMI